MGKEKEPANIKTDEAEEGPEKPAAPKRRWALWISIALLALFLLGGFGFYEYSNTPEFCNSCHIMNPYYDAWESGSHAEVACVKCHISPKEGAYVESKIDGMLQGIKYLTRRVASKPYAEIEDASCLRSGCHEERVVEEHATEYFGNGVAFDHNPHLTETRRGKDLRCTSCHAQMVVGNHMEVTTSTCFLCHFRESDTHDVSELSECRLCHKQLPKDDLKHDIYHPLNDEEVVDSIEFNHVDYFGDRDVNCDGCHDQLTHGTGEARQERCFVCHNDPSHLERIEDISFIHLNHITEHNVTCSRCHDEVVHSKEEVPIVVNNSCTECHEFEHDEQRKMFRGYGAQDVEEVTPSPMYSYKVACSGCHQEADQDHIGHIAKTYVAPKDFTLCENCHGDDSADYIESFIDMSDETKDRLASVEAQLNNVKNRRLTRLTEEQQKVVDSAEHNIKFIRDSRGWAHNSYYTETVLDHIESTLNEIK
jgi:hypothetical protein